MISLTPTGQDVLFAEKRLETGNFANKIWNAARFVHDAPRRRGPRRRCAESPAATLDARRPLDPVALRQRGEGRDAQPRRRTASTRRRTRSTSSSGTSTATGTSSWPSRAVRGDGRPTPSDDRRCRALGVVEGARRHPAPAASVHAVRHRGDLAGAAARRRDCSRWRRGRARRRRGSTPRPSARSPSCRSWWWRCATCASRTGSPPGRRAGRGARRAPRSSSWSRSSHAQLQPLARIETLTVSRDGCRARAWRPRPWCRAPRSSCRSRAWSTSTRSASAWRARPTEAARDLEGTSRKLRNPDFLNKAQPEVVERERQRLAQLEETLDKLKRAQESLRGEKA